MGQTTSTSPAKQQPLQLHACPQEKPLECTPLYTRKQTSTAQRREPRGIRVKTINLAAGETGGLFFTHSPEEEGIAQTAFPHNPKSPRVEGRDNAEKAAHFSSQRQTPKEASTGPAVHGKSGDEAASQRVGSILADSFRIRFGEECLQRA